MSKYSVKAPSTIVTNYEGGKSYKLDERTELVTHVLTSFMKNDFYRTEAAAVARLNQLIDAVTVEFAAKLAIVARNEFGMRSVSHYISARIASRLSGNSIGKDFYSNVVRRVDDMAEICAVYFFLNPGKDITNAMKKGFSTAFARFDEYQLAKYKGEGKTVSLVDVVRLVHPFPVAKNAEALKKLIYNDLKSHGTWESELSAAGNEDDVITAKGDVWKKLVEGKSIGYFALLRNLRNIITQAPESINAVCELLVNEKAIRGSLVLPFRFYTAMEELKSVPGSSKVMQAVAQAADISLKNLPEMPGRTLVVLDVSTSMTSSSGRNMSPAKIGALFAAALCKATYADFMVFARDAEYRNLDISSSVLSMANSIEFKGGATKFDTIFAKAKGPYERIFILSDMQGWAASNSSLYHTGQYGNLSSDYAAWCKKYDCSPKLFSFDLKGYGTGMFPQNNVFIMSGFSEKIFEILPALEKDRNALRNYIESVEI